jgi:deoxyribodipyrimidine photo-lyase
MQTLLVHLQQDLRLVDHPALYHAADRADRVVPVYVWDPERFGDWRPGSGQRWWLRRSLDALATDLQSRGSTLVCRAGDTDRQLFALADTLDASGIYWNRRHRPDLADAAEQTARLARDRDLTVERFSARLMHDPDAVQTTTGGPYQVYTPFWNRFLDLVDVDRPLEAPDLDGAPLPDSLEKGPDPADLIEMDDDTSNDPYDGWWTPSEPAAHDRLDHVIDNLLADYHDTRDRPDIDGTTRLSPYLRSGQLSARFIWHRVHDALDLSRQELLDEQPVGPVTFLQELVWREFAYHLLHHFPTTTRRPLREKFLDFDWRDAPDDLLRWQRGETGFPLVDAGMRQLRRRGWIHNRIRMVVASFLTKDLLIPWQYGAEHFWELLVDADLASNTLGWQWAAGCGADAQPFFRIFNPVSQSQKHDPDGDYIRRYVPELADLPTAALHAPWDADRSTLNNHGIELGVDYPEPMVDHSQARERALECYNRIK